MSFSDYFLNSLSMEVLRYEIGLALRGIENREQEVHQEFIVKEFLSFRSESVEIQHNDFVRVFKDKLSNHEHTIHKIIVAIVGSMNEDKSLL